MRHDHRYPESASSGMLTNRCDEPNQEFSRGVAGLYLWDTRVLMAKNRDWEKFNRNRRASDSRNLPRSGPSLAQTFEALSYYLKLNEPEGGNFAVVPAKWKSMLDVDLHRYRVAHRRRACAENRSWFDYAAGDRWVRIRDETVEMLNLRNCEVCATHIRRA